MKEDERRKGDEFKKEWYWNGYLTRRNADHVSYSTYEDSD